jgi:hypothetical protein
LPTRPAQRLAREPLNGTVPVEDFSRVRFLEEGGDPEECGLPGPASPDHAEDEPALDLEGNVAQGRSGRMGCSFERGWRTVATAGARLLGITLPEVTEDEGCFDWTVRRGGGRKGN